VDFSAVTDRVCETAAALAGDAYGRVVLLHCDSPADGNELQDVEHHDLATLASAADDLLAGFKAALGRACPKNRVFEKRRKTGFWERRLAGVIGGICMARTGSRLVLGPWRSRASCIRA
jgi:hypothetical protein